MAGPGEEIAAGAGGRGHLRASHGDRELVIDVLKAAFVQGRLDRDEFDLRVGRALASRTYADLAALTADIPVRLTRARPPEPARESAHKANKANRKKNAVVALACATPTLPGVIYALPPIPDGSPLVMPVFVLLVVWGMAVPTGWLVVFHAWLDKRAGRRSAQGLPPGGGGAASRSLAPPDPAGQLPQVDRDPWPAAEATPIRRPRPALPSWRTPNRRRPLGCRYAIGYPL
jgi:hypothetical protein